MPLIKSISGIRGTIGNIEGENLTPAAIVKFTAAFATLLLEKQKENKMSHKNFRRFTSLFLTLVISFAALGSALAAPAQDQGSGAAAAPENPSRSTTASTAARTPSAATAGAWVQQARRTSNT